MDLISLAIAIASFALAGLAIYFSVKFFTLSEQTLRTLAAVTSRIEAAVLRVEPTLDRLYADTFGLVKDAMGDLRARASPAESGSDHLPRVEARTAMQDPAALKIDQLRDELTNQLATVAEEAGADPTQDLQEEIADVVVTAIQRTRDADAGARVDALRRELTALYEAAHASGRPVVAGDLTRVLVPRFGYHDVADAFLDLRRSGVLEWSGELQPESVVEMNKRSG